MNESTILGQIAARYQERIRGYQELLDFYNGKQWFGRERAGEKRLTFNYAKIFVDKMTSYLMSGINFTVEALEDTPEARARAVEAEKSLSRVYEANNLLQLDLETETDCAVLGDGCYKVTWEEGPVSSSEFRVWSSGKRERGRVRVTAPDIQGIHAWWMGDDMSRIWRVSSKYSLSSEEVEMMYGAKLGASSSKLVTVVELWTDSDFELYLDGVLADHKPNPYSFIPFIIYPNLRDPKKFWGTSDLCPIIEPQRELNRAMSQVSHILELSGNPVAVLQNVEESSDISVRPGAVWNIPEDAKAYLLDLLQGGGLQLHINYIELLYRVLHDISEAPRAAFGGMDRALSGVAMQIELYPLLQKILRKRAIRSTVYNRRSRMILDLLAKFSPSPQLAASSSKLEASPDFHVRTVWGQILPQDMEKLVANEQVLVQTGIHSRRRAMN
jgi:hypothetical protein